MAAIQSNMGVCPQFDVLWNELTGLEHLIIFGYMKGLPNKATVRAEADKLLKEARSSITVRVMYRPGRLAASPYSVSTARMQHRTRA